MGNGAPGDSSLAREGRGIRTAFYFVVRKLRLSPAQVAFTFAIIVGLASGLGAYVFKNLITLVDNLCSLNDAGVAPLGKSLIIIPALGGAIVGPLIYYFAREVKGGGVPETMLAVRRYGGRIRPIVSLIKIVASALTIGTGGSAGSEGPTVQIGAGFGSTLGQIFRMPPKRITTLVACGAAGGVSAIFNAPFAGVMFSLEVVLGSFSSLEFIYVVLSSMTAAALSRALTGDIPVFALPTFTIVNHLEIVVYFGLGVLTAFVAKAFTVTLIGAQAAYDRVRLPEYVKPATGGLAVGLIAYFGARLMPGTLLSNPLAVMGVGYEAIGEVMDKATYLEPVLVPIALLLLFKLICTCFTIGSGGSGGMFAPSLFLGAMTGGIFGILIGKMLPGTASSPAVYALVGMGACFAGTTLAPISAIFLVYEMSGRYEIILPIMAAVSGSFLISRWIRPRSIYEEVLLRRGIDLGTTEKKDFLRTVIVRNVMIREPQVIRDTMTLAELAPRVGKDLHTSQPVIDEGDEIVGIVTYRELHPAMTSGIPWSKLMVRDFMKADPVIVYSDETVADAMKRMTEAYVGMAPVVSRYGKRTVQGVVTFRHLYSAYKRAIQE